jgi:hypothetical protein
VTVNEENMRKWINDLRTTDAPQLKGALSDGVAYCCLGRACELAVAEGVITRHEQAGGFYIYGPAGEGESCVLPVEVFEWLGLDERNPVLGRDEDGFIVWATKANDTLRWTFAQIGDALEREYLS